MASVSWVLADRQADGLPECCRVLATADAVLREHDVAIRPQIAVGVGQRLGERFAREVAGFDERLTDGHALLDALAGALFDRDATAVGAGFGCSLVVFALAQCHQSSPLDLVSVAGGHAEVSIGNRSIVLH